LPHLRKIVVVDFKIRLGEEKHCLANPPTFGLEELLSARLR
jgi:hypothetical protein